MTNIDKKHPASAGCFLSNAECRVQNAELRVCDAIIIEN